MKKPDVVVQELLLSKLRLDGGTQPRVALDEETVGEYADAIADGAQMPPLKVMFDGSTYWLYDGFHRFFGHKEAGEAKARCEITQGTRRDAVLASLGANDTHGLRRSNADKRRAVEIALADEEWRELSDREIAKLCHVSHTHVAEVRRAGQPTVQAVPLPVAPPAPKVEAKPVAAPPGWEKKPSAPPAPARPAPAPRQQTEEPDDDDTLSTADVISDLQQQVRELREREESLDAADPRAEILKLKTQLQVAMRRQGELMDRVRQLEAQLDGYARRMQRIQKAVGEDDPTKVAAVIEAKFRRAA